MLREPGRSKMSDLWVLHCTQAEEHETTDRENNYAIHLH